MSDPAWQDRYPDQQCRHHGTDCPHRGQRSRHCAISSLMPHCAHLCWWNARSAILIEVSETWRWRLVEGVAKGVCQGENCLRAQRCIGSLHQTPSFRAAGRKASRAIGPCLQFAITFSGNAEMISTRPTSHRAAVRASQIQLRQFSTRTRVVQEGPIKRPIQLAPARPLSREGIARAHD